MENSVKNLIQFIDHSPSCFHVIENAKKQFLEHGFIQLEEKEHWNLEEGKSYFVERNGSSMIAFHLPKKDFQGFHIVASHSDSPTYRIKEQPEMSVEKHYTKLNIERYGGMIPETWFDRPLSVAGRIIIEENGQIKDQLVNVDRDLMIIPNLAIHMSRSSNESKQLNPQKDLLPLCGGNLTKDGFEEMIAKESGVEKEDILSYDLFLYNRMRGTTLGINEEFVYSDAEIQLIDAYSDLTDELHTDLHECLGHGSGKLLPGVDPDALKAYGSTIEEARADLFGLYYVADPKLVELGLLSSPDAYKAQYYTYLMNGLMTQLVRIEPGNSVEEAHMRNRQLIARWVFEKGAADKAVELVKKDGKTYVVINDYQKVRQLFGELLAEIQRIKSTGDFEGARTLVENYAVKVDPALHAEVLERYKKLNLAPYKGFVNPKYELVTDENGTVTDVTVSYDEGYVEQMLRYSTDYSPLPSINN